MRKTAAFTIAFALMAAPAFAQGPDHTPRGQTVSPAKICEGKSKRQVPGTNGQTPFAACVSGVRRQNAEARREGSTANLKTPAETCQGFSRKRRTAGAQSPYAACVSGAAQAQRELKAAARD